MRAEIKTSMSNMKEAISNLTVTGRDIYTAEYMEALVGTTGFQNPDTHFQKLDGEENPRRNLQ